MDEGALVRDLNVNVAFETLKVQRSDHLPALSWFLRVASGTAELTCGTSVETAESHFLEGGWSGPFEGANFAGAANVFGSGATRVDGTWMLVPPSHTLRRFMY